MKIRIQPSKAIGILLFCFLASTATAQIHGNYFIDESDRQPVNPEKNAILDFNGAPRMIKLKVDSTDILRDSSFFIEYQMLTWGPAPTRVGNWTVSDGVVTLEYESCVSVCQDDWVEICDCRQYRLRVRDKEKLIFVDSDWKGITYLKLQREF